jgi:hypothetical protein
MGCGVAASFSWHDRYLLYSSTDGPTVVIDTRDGSVSYLSELAARLPRRVPAERPTAYWLSEVTS